MWKHELLSSWTNPIPSYYVRTHISPWFKSLVCFLLMHMESGIEKNHGWWLSGRPFRKQGNAFNSIQFDSIQTPKKQEELGPVRTSTPHFHLHYYTTLWIQISHHSSSTSEMRNVVEFRVRLFYRIHSSCEGSSSSSILSFLVHILFPLFSCTTLILRVMTLRAILPLLVRWTSYKVFVYLFLKSK